MQTLGDGTEDGGGYKGRVLRWEVLDRLARLGAGLSDGQKNDWTWFKSSWDEAMPAEHTYNWPYIFAGFMQGVLDDERTNAFCATSHAQPKTIPERTQLNEPNHTTPQAA